MAGQDDKKSKEEGNVSENNIAPTESEPSVELNFTEEYDFLDSKLDELHSALDFLERKNEDIQERLQELLVSNRNIREQLQNENNMQVENGQ